MHAALVALLHGCQWRNNLGALRSFVTANYDQPNPHNQAVMASPPTVTVSAGLPAGMAVSFTVSPDTQETAALRVLGGRMFLVGGNYRIYSADIGATGGNGGSNDGKECSGWRADVSTSAPIVTFRIAPTTSGYRFIVDGQYVSLTPTQTVGTTGSTSEYFKVDFGSSVMRQISIEGERTCGLVSVWVASGQTCARPTTEAKRISFAGDSFTFGSGATSLGDSYGWVTADMLGFRHALLSGSGGTGYVATGASAVKLFDRLSDINDRGPHDIIVCAMGVNDIGQSAASITGQVLGCLLNLRRTNRSAQIFVVGPWDVNAPAAPVANYATTKAAILAGIPSGAGITFLDAEGVSYTKSDATHPDTAGHATLGAWLALQIKTALGA